MACQLGNHDWTDADVATVRNLYETTPLSAAAIGRKFGVGKGSILGLAKRKGFQERPRLFNNSVSWSPEEDEILRAAIADGKDDLDISHLLSKRTRNGIKNRRISLGIALSGGALARGSSRGAIARNVIAGRAARWERDKSNPKPPMVIHAVFPADLRCEAVPYTPEHAGCRWMISGGRPWTVCAAKRADGESYCRAHSDRSSYFIQREMAA